MAYLYQLILLLEAKQYIVDYMGLLIRRYRGIKMQVFVARQPILDINRRVVYYELLFRSNLNNFYSGLDGDKATLDVITNSFTTIGMRNITNGKKAFINFTENLLLKETPLMLSSKEIVVEILENVNPTPVLIESCKKLKDLGYMLALDDFVFKPGYEKLIELADFIKVDFIITKGRERKLIIDRFNNGNIKFIAEKVETMEDFNEALEYGFTYFQGYFFSKPAVLSGKELPSRHLQGFELIKYINEDNYDLVEIEEVIKKNVSLSFKLLKYINSASLGMKTEISSIKQALVLMGKREFIKWCVLVTLRDVSDKESETLMDMSVVRARFGEEIADSIKLSTRASEIFIMEMFSSIDVILKQPMERILVDLPIAEDIKAALLGEDNIFNNINMLVQNYEKGNWSLVSDYVRKLGIEESKVSLMYANALEWAANVLKD